jgi:DNA-binding FrmR family transcriptional regulator
MAKRPAASPRVRAEGKNPRLVTFEENKRELLTQRLNRLSGQLEGIKRMVEEGRYCIDILNQVASAQEGLRSFSRVVMRNYLESCATSALRSAEPEEAQRIYDEIMDQLFKHAR